MIPLLEEFYKLTIRPHYYACLQSTVFISIFNLKTTLSLTPDANKLVLVAKLALLGAYIGDGQKLRLHAKELTVTKAIINGSPAILALMPKMTS